MEHIGKTLKRLDRERRGQPPRPLPDTLLPQAQTGIARALRLPVGSFLDEGDTLDPSEEAEEDVNGAEEGAENEASPSSSRWNRVVESTPVRLLPEPWRRLPTQTSHLESSTGTKLEVCPVCKGMGYTRADVPFGHPDFGRAIKCPCRLKREKERQRQQLLEMSNLDRLEAFREASFATFDLFQPGVREAYQAALAFAEAPIGWLVLAGINGCGKTHLAVAIARHRLDAGDIVLFMTVPDLLDHLRATFVPTAQVTYDDLFQKMREADLLVLDDLGAEHGSPWASEKLFQLLNFR